MMAINEVSSCLDNTAGVREWAGLALLAAPTILLGLDLTLLHLLLPALAVDLRPTSTQMLWIIDAYGFMIAGLLVSMGTLGDRAGRRKLLMVGAAAFAAASVMAAYSTSAAMLIAARVLLGIAGATLMPSTLALISNMFCQPHQRALAIGVWATMFAWAWRPGPWWAGRCCTITDGGPHSWWQSRLSGCCWLPRRFSCRSIAHHSRASGYRQRHIIVVCHIAYRLRHQAYLQGWGRYRCFSDRRSGIGIHVFICPAPAPLDPSLT